MSDFPEFQHKPSKKPNYKERIRLGLQKQEFKKTRLKPISDNKKSFLDKYIEQKENDQEDQVCKLCNKNVKKSECEPHHTHGRVGENLLKYIWIHPECHKWIHENSKKARELGLLC